MSDPQPRYLSFLVRLWRAGHNGAALWRASVDNPHTAERHYFADLAALFAFLEAQTAGQVEHVITSLEQECPVPAPQPPDDISPTHPRSS
jgi:hypothetical protein